MSPNSSTSSSNQKNGNDTNTCFLNVPFTSFEVEAYVFSRVRHFFTISRDSTLFVPKDPQKLNVMGKRMQIHLLTKDMFARSTFATLILFILDH